LSAIRSSFGLGLTVGDREPTFAALKQAFGDHYIYAGLGTSFATGSGAGAEQRRGKAPALDAEDLVSYRSLAKEAYQ